jgi:nucleoside 2-deoxyribosyltransferase
VARLTVTLCGSLRRAGHDLHRVHRALALAGHLVHAPVPALPGEPEPTAGQKHNLTTRHLAAIRRSDLVIAVVPDRRPGGATAEEMRYADIAGIRARWVMSPADVDALIADIAAGRLDQWPAAVSAPAG